MDHNTKILVSFKNAIIIADTKILELEEKLKLNDNKKDFYEAGIIIGHIIRNIYYAFDTNNFDALQELNHNYNEQLVITLNILEQLVKKNIMNEYEYLQYANMFMKRKKEYDILCNNPYIAEGIALCQCCVPKSYIK